MRNKHIEDSRSHKLGLLNQDLSFCGLENPAKIYSIDIESDQFKHLIKEKRDQLCDGCLREILDRHGAIEQCYCSQCYIPDFIKYDTKESIESEFNVDIVDKSQSMKYVVVKKKTERTYSLQELRSLFEIDLRSALNRYADSEDIKLFCYHENIVFDESRVEILAHTEENCSPIHTEIQELLSENVPQGTDKNSGICNQCGNLTEPEQDYCLDCFDLLDHNTIAADLREQKRLLEVAAYHGAKNFVGQNIMSPLGKALELNLQMNADLVKNETGRNKLGGPEEGEINVTTSPSSDISNFYAMEEELIDEPSIVCSWCDRVIKETSSLLVSHTCCDDCMNRLEDEDAATSEAI